MEQVIRLGITAGDPNLKSNIFFARERFNLALKTPLLYAPSLGDILTNQNETEVHSTRKDCTQTESV